MFGLGLWELVVIAVVALLFIGPEKLPNLFRALGRATREFQRASQELRENLSIEEPPAYPPVYGPAPPAPPVAPAALPPNTSDAAGEPPDATRAPAAGGADTGGGAQVDPGAGPPGRVAG